MILWQFWDCFSWLSFLVNWWRETWSYASAFTNFSFVELTSRQSCWPRRQSSHLIEDLGSSHFPAYLVTHPRARRTLTGEHAAHLVNENLQQIKLCDINLWKRNWKCWELFSPSDLSKSLLGVYPSLVLHLYPPDWECYIHVYIIFFLNNLVTKNKLIERPRSVSWP